LTIPEAELEDALGQRDARAPLLENLIGPLDAVVCDQIVAESHGNPLALLEFRGPGKPGSSPADWATGE
jgi:hypothetical protein